VADNPIRTTWAVHVRGTDDLLPAEGRADAHQRAHDANTTLLATEAGPTPPHAYAPSVWAVPYELDEPQTVTVHEIEDAWKEWHRG